MKEYCKVYHNDENDELVNSIAKFSYNEVLYTDDNGTMMLNPIEYNDNIHINHYREIWQVDFEHPPKIVEQSRVIGWKQIRS